MRSPARPSPRPHRAADWRGVSIRLPALDPDRRGAPASNPLTPLAALQSCLARHGIERSGRDVVVVACSGGIDSVALAHAAAESLGARRVVLGHVDHAVRPNSAADADAVRALATRLGARFSGVRLPPGPADEARLREARYGALRAQRAEAGARYVLTAHNEDDQAETVLMGLFRSASPRALLGMPELRDDILRPWLTVSRAKIAAYVDRHGLPVREDVTNREPRYLRNRVRKELIPLLERRYRPRLATRLCALATEMARLLNESDFRVGQRTIAPMHTRAHPAAPHRLSPWLAGRLWLKMERCPWPGGPVPDGTQVAVFDAEQVGTPHIRLIRPGDRIRPFGMSGHRKLRDLLREHDVAQDDRPVVPVAVDPQDRVLWLPGIARSAWAPISGTTREVWRFSIGQDHELQARESRATLDGAINGKT